MRALTLCEPYASALVFGPKRIENRPVRFNHRGPLAIHAGRSHKWMTRAAIDLLHREWPGFPADEVAVENYLLPRMGKVIGVVDVVGCYHISDTSAWVHGEAFVFGPWCIVTENPRALRSPFWLRGRQGLMTIPDEQIEAAQPVPVPEGSGFRWDGVDFRG